jgi:hypothetical protein
MRHQQLWRQQLQQCWGMKVAEAAQHISSICKLPAARQLRYSAFDPLVQAATEQQNARCKNQLMKVQMDA